MTAPMRVLTQADKDRAVHILTVLNVYPDAELVKHDGSYSVRQGNEIIGHGIDASNAWEWAAWQARNVSAERSTRDAAEDVDHLDSRFMILVIEAAIVSGVGLLLILYGLYRAAMWMYRLAVDSHYYTFGMVACALLTMFLAMMFREGKR